jgi:hypothetical protein
MPQALRKAKLLANGKPWVLRDSDWSYGEIGVVEVAMLSSIFATRDFREPVGVRPYQWLSGQKSTASTKSIACPQQVS